MCIPDADLYEQRDGPGYLKEEYQTRCYSEIEPQKFPFNEQKEKYFCELQSYDMQQLNFKFIFHCEYNFILCRKL